MHITKFIGATRKQVGKDINDDAFAVFDGMFAFLMDGAGEARGAAQKCIDTIKSYQPQMPSFNQLVTLLNMTLIGYGAESTLLAIKVEDNFLSGVSCGDSPLYVIRDGQLLRVNKNTKPRLGTSRPDIYRIALSLKRHDVIIAASDGFVLDGDKLVDTVGQHISKPGELSEVLLEAQTYCGDDVTVITRVL
jgi:serine/threonine protein phosphatase PrpC